MQDIHCEFEQTAINPLTPTANKGGLGCVWRQLDGQPDGLGIIVDFYGGMAHFDNDGVVTKDDTQNPFDATAANLVWNDGLKFFVKPNFDWRSGQIVNNSLPTPTFFYLYGKTGDA